MLQFVKARDESKTDIFKSVSEKSFTKLNLTTQNGFEQHINKRLVRILLKEESEV